MARRIKVSLDHHGIAEILKSSDMHEMVDEAAEKIADRVRGSIPADAPVVTRSYTTDRAAAVVVIEDLRGMVYQASDGVLTRAATSIGAQVKERVR